MHLVPFEHRVLPLQLLVVKFVEVSASSSACQVFELIAKILELPRHAELGLALALRILLLSDEVPLVVHELPGLKVEDGGSHICSGLLRAPGLAPIIILSSFARVAGYLPARVGYLHLLVLIGPILALVSLILAVVGYLRHDGSSLWLDRGEERVVG